MQLVNDITKACPFGLQSSALENAAMVAKACESERDAFAVARSLGGASPSIQVIPYDAPYGPWWVIQVTVGASVGFIADDHPVPAECIV